MPIQFQYPQVLWALSILVVPILIHLFHFKRFKKVYFSNIQFLQSINIENKKKSKLKKWLILLFRMLALTCIILAFAQPYLPDNNSYNKTQEQETIHIYIDNSFSMNAKTEKGIALELAKNKAFDLLNGLPDFAPVKIYSNNFSPGNFMIKNQAIAKIQDIQPSPTHLQLSYLLKQIQVNKDERLQRIYLLSDFQKYQSDIENIAKDSLQIINLLPLQIQHSNNLILDSCWFNQPNHDLSNNEELFVSIRNQSDLDYQQIPIQLSINDSTRSVANFDIKKHGQQVVQLRYANRNTGIHFGKVEIKDFPIAYDNELYFSYIIQNQTKILSVNQEEKNNYLTQLFSNSKQFQFRNIAKSAFFNENTHQYNLIILNEIKEMESGFQHTVSKYLAKGGHVLFIPGDEVKESVNSFLKSISAPTYEKIDSSKQRIAKLELNTKIYQNVFEEIKDNSRLPDIYKYYQSTISANNLTESIWQTAGGDPLFSKSVFGKGVFYQFNFKLNHDWGNVQTHPIFVPTLINLSLRNGSNRNIWYNLAQQKELKIKRQANGNNTLYHIQNTDLTLDIIPNQKYDMENSVILNINNLIQQAGNYSITYQDSIIAPCSFNYSRKESDPNFYTSDELKNLNQNLNLSIISSTNLNLSELYKEQREGKKYWAFFVVLCILFFLTESILQKLNFFKR